MDQLVVANTINKVEEENISGLDDKEESEWPKIVRLEIPQQI
jgi:hypothetical protein